MHYTAPINVIITGATGMVGEGVLLSCLDQPSIARVLVLVRKPLSFSHPKMEVLVHNDFHDLQAVEARLANYQACYFCLGISSVGVNKARYFATTYELTLYVAHTLSRLNPDMSFCYVSGAGTDSKERSRLSWARVKGRTENELCRLPFKQVFNFRPGFIKPLKSQQFAHKLYQYLGWLYPIGRLLYPKGFCTMEELAKAMLIVTFNGYPNNPLEGTDIIRAARQPLPSVGTSTTI